LRELTFVEEELEQVWARKMKELLLEMKAEVERAKANGQSQLDRLLLAGLLCRYDGFLQEGYQANPPPGPPRKSAQGKRLRRCAPAGSASSQAIISIAVFSLFFLNACLEAHPTCF
jgi:hypothetical protein